MFLPDAVSTLVASFIRGKPLKTEVANPPIARAVIKSGRVLDPPALSLADDVVLTGIKIPWNHSVLLGYPDSTTCSSSRQPAVRASLVFPSGSASMLAPPPEECNSAQSYGKSPTGDSCGTLFLLPHLGDQLLKKLDVIEDVGGWLPF